MTDKLLVRMCRHYFGRKRAKEYLAHPDSVMTGILLDIIDYGYDRAMANYYGLNYHGSIKCLQKP